MNREELLKFKKEYDEVEDIFIKKLTEHQAEIDALMTKFREENQLLILAKTDAEHKYQEAFKAFKERIISIFNEDKENKQIEEFVSIQVRKKIMVAGRYTTSEVVALLSKNLPVALTYDMKKLKAIPKLFSKDEIDNLFPFLNIREVPSVVFRKEFWDAE